MIGKHTPSLIIQSVFVFMMLANAPGISETQEPKHSKERLFREPPANLEEDPKSSKDQLSPRPRVGLIEQIERQRKQLEASEGLEGITKLQEKAIEQLRSDVKTLSQQNQNLMRALYEQRSAMITAFMDKLESKIDSAVDWSFSKPYTLSVEDKAAMAFVKAVLTKAHAYEYIRKWAKSGNTDLEERAVRLAVIMAADNDGTTRVTQLKNFEANQMITIGSRSGKVGKASIFEYYPILKDLQN